MCCVSKCILWETPNADWLTECFHCSKRYPVTWRISYVQNIIAIWRKNDTQHSTIRDGKLHKRNTETLSQAVTRQYVTSYSYRGCSMHKIHQHVQEFDAFIESVYIHEKSLQHYKYYDIKRYWHYIICMPHQKNTTDTDNKLPKN